MVSQACGRVTAFGIWFDVKYEKIFCSIFTISTSAGIPPPINQVNSSSACGQYYKASTIVIFKSIVENISNFILVRKTLELQFTLLEAI